MPKSAAAASAEAAGTVPAGTVAPGTAGATSAEAIDRLLPQTQCERCGHPGCLPYARAIAKGAAPINRCAPGGHQTIIALAALTGQAIIEPAADCQPIDARLMARIDEAVCIGCTKCILACPVDAIAGAARHRHRVLPERCTGCELCLPPCPVDCIVIEPMATAWTEADADRAREHHRAHLARRRPAQPTADPMAKLAEPDERRRRLAAILARTHGAMTPQP